jgi:hypothetical protein
MPRESGEGRGERGEGRKMRREKESERKRIDSFYSRRYFGLE